MSRKRNFEFMFDEFKVKGYSFYILNQSCKWKPRTREMTGNPRPERGENSVLRN